ncbi:SDR family NAD(P)-dependent oxidoreductase [Priestia megaterium]|uniref:SDR family NAD(P)-dependent oxidoreductase n=1 Tax=Priestia megaterium TaxID=1404 RepID=UPI00279595A0|nr:SDR family oxidoreductase [Priestia megaterium]
MERLSGKVALITGAGNGLGAAVAKLLAEEGAKVIATDIDYNSVKKIAEEINKESNESAIALKHDVSSKDEWLSVVEEGVKTFGPITVLVNNAGILATTKYDQLTYEKWQKVMDINAWGQFVGMQTVVPYMKKAGIGSIINVSSIAAVNSGGGLTAYTASKGAVDAMSRAAAVELGEFNIRVNAVIPGVIKTQLFEEAFPTKEAKDAAMASQPLKRVGRSIDVAYLVAYLASDESYFTSGTSQLIDGALNVDGSRVAAKLD